MLSPPFPSLPGTRGPPSAHCLCGFCYERCAEVESAAASPRHVRPSCSPGCGCCCCESRPSPRTRFPVGRHGLLDSDPLAVACSPYQLLAAPPARVPAVSEGWNESRPLLLTFDLLCPKQSAYVARLPGVKVICVCLKTSSNALPVGISPKRLLRALLGGVA